MKANTLKLLAGYVKQMHGVDARNENPQTNSNPLRSISTVLAYRHSKRLGVLCVGGVGVNRAEYLSRAYEFALRGEQAPSHKLTKAQVIDIRKNVKGQTYQQLALDFGVHVNTIYKIRKGITWTVLTNP